MPQSYTYNNINVFPPTGSIMAYLGNTDPNGWVIMDGISRTNSNGIYNNLISLGIGTGNSTNYTPPDYRGAFLRGDNKGSALNALDSGYGSYSHALNTSQTHATQTHNHTITDPGHKHRTNVNSGSVWYGNQSTFSYATNDGNSTTESDSAVTGITINNSTLSVDPNETRPYNFAVNWIIKL